MSVSTGKKMKIADLSRAIKNVQDFGPIFGEDLVIRHECNSHRNNSAEIPSAYGDEEDREMDRQHLWTDFCGAP